MMKYKDFNPCFSAFLMNPYFDFSKLHFALFFLSRKLTLFLKTVVVIVFQYVSLGLQFNGHYGPSLY